MATTMTMSMTQEQRNEWLQRAWDAQGEGHVLPRRSPKDRDDHRPKFYPNRRVIRPRR